MATLPHSAEQNIPVSYLPPKRTTIDLIGGIHCHICTLTFGNKKEFDSHYANHKKGEEETVYTCVACGKQFPSYKCFREHCYNIHVVKDKFKCQHCSRMFSKSSLLSQHVITMHKFTCVTCNRQFPSKKELTVHEILHKIEKSKPPYPCLTCKKIIDNSDVCEMHIDEHSKTLYPCPICEETLTTKLDAVKHLTKHFGDVFNERDLMDISEPPNEDSSVDIIGGILCCFCDDLFKTRTEFDIHFVAEHGDRDLVYTCIICKKEYKKYMMFGHHCHFHIMRNKYECDDCGKMFSRLSLLITHTEVFHSGEAVDKPFSCNICGHAFKSQHRLLSHRRLVHSVIPVDCPQCGKVFDSHRDMLLHQREHKSTHQNCCRLCSLKFTTLSSCEKHLDVHRIKNYSCPICSKEYKEKYLIIKHISFHFESVLHICKVCSKTYNSRARLQTHKKTHMAVKNYTCTYCSKGFVKPIDLQQHTNIHTGLKPYKCSNCPKSFANHPNWMKHVQRIHNIDGEVRRQISPKCNQLNQAKMNSNPISETMPIGATPNPPIREYDVNSINNIDAATIQKELQIFCENNNAQNCELFFDIDDMLPENTATLVADTLETIEPSITSVCVPPEYGPEFVNRSASVETSATLHGDFIDLDDYIMPHIDPLLTIQDQLFQPEHIAYDNYDQNASKYAPNGWEPPNVTRFYPNYPPHYDITDLTRLTSL